MAGHVHGCTAIGAVSGSTDNHSHRFQIPSDWCVASPGPSAQHAATAGGQPASSPCRPLGSPCRGGSTNKLQAKITHGHASGDHISLLLLLAGACCCRPGDPLSLSSSALLSLLWLQACSNHQMQLQGAWLQGEGPPCVLQPKPPSTCGASPAGAHNVMNKTNL